MGSDESHFNVSLIVGDKVIRQCPQTTNFEEKGEPKRIRIEVPLLSSLTARPNRLTTVPLKTCLLKSTGFGFAVQHKNLHRRECIFRLTGPRNQKELFICHTAPARCHHWVPSVTLASSKWGRLHRNGVSGAPATHSTRGVWKKLCLKPC